VLFGLLATVVVLLLLGQKRHVFQQRVHLYSMFSDVGGLVTGAPVQVAGVSVGTVARISFDRTQPKPLIRVEIEITRDALDLIRADSVAHISSQGLLGDKLIDISAGSRASMEIAAGGRVSSEAPVTIDRLLSDATYVMRRLQTVADNIAVLSQELASERTRADLRDSLAAIRTLLEATAHGRGLMHALFYDPRSAQALPRIATGVDQAVAHINKAIAALEPILKSTDVEGRQVVNNISRAAKGVGQVATELERSQVVHNLASASADLAQVSGQLRRGEGTLGALVQDPTVYEQLVTILGGVGRSRILRALVRYAISKGEQHEAQHLQAKQPPPPPPGRRQGKR
jgi:phospholipid/cholesterol/gamma-HCH transport system substrate-binding protein